MRSLQKKYYPSLDGVKRHTRWRSRIALFAIWLLPHGEWEESRGGTPFGRSRQGAKLVFFGIGVGVKGGEEGGYYDTPLGVHCPLSKLLIVLLTNRYKSVTV